jgi:hypothetical protein
LKKSGYFGGYFEGFKNPFHPRSERPPSARPDPTRKASRPQSRNNIPLPKSLPQIESDTSLDRPRMTNGHYFSQLPDEVLPFVTQSLTLHEEEQLAQAYLQFQPGLPQTPDDKSKRKFKDLLLIATECLGAVFFSRASSAESQKEQQENLELLLDSKSLSNFLVDTLRKSSSASFDLKFLADVQPKTAQQAELQAQMMIAMCEAASGAVKKSPHLESVYLDVCTRVSVSPDMEVIHKKPVDVADYIFGASHDQTGFKNLRHADLGVPKKGRVNQFQLDSHAASLESCGSLKSLTLRMRGSQGLSFLQTKIYSMGSMLEGPRVDGYQPSPTAKRIECLGLSTDLFVSLLESKGSGISDWISEIPPVQHDLGGPYQKRTLPKNDEWTPERLNTFAGQQKSDQDRWKQACAGLSQTLKIEVSSGLTSLDVKALDLSARIVSQAPVCKTFIFPDQLKMSANEGAQWAHQTFGRHTACLSVQIGEHHFERETADGSKFAKKY